MTRALFDDLNKRELEIIQLLAEGLSNKQIAQRLFLAVNTVKWYISQLNSKLGTRTRQEIVAQAKTLNLITSSAKTNLPYQITPFVGRENELHDLQQLFAELDAHLLTILAQGGMGKTRLALEFARRQIPNFRDGVYFIPLQHIQKIDKIILTIAEHTPFFFRQDSHPPKQQVFDYLANKQMLLLIDNIEHLLEGMSILTELLQHAPDVRLVVTSRERLNLLGETVYTLQGLSIPQQESIDDVLNYDSVQLVSQSAQRIKPKWQLDKQSLPHVIRLCQLTQGMPLGILLAVSWLDVYSIERINDEIERSLDFLETDMRDVPERQRSIRYIFDYVWGRLSQTDRRIWQALSVFRDGFTAEASEQVVGTDGHVLKRLVNKALITVNEAGRYDLHELLRQYAEAKLLEDINAGEIYLHYLHYYADLLNSLTIKLKGQGQLEAFRQMQVEFENIHSAWQVAIKTKCRVCMIKMLESIVIFLDGTTRFDELATFLREAHHLLSNYQTQAGQDEFARVLLWRGALYEHREQMDEAYADYIQALDLLKTGDNHALRALATLYISTFMDDLEARAEAINQALATFRKLELDWGMVKALDSKAYLAFSQGDLTQGIAYTEQCAGLYREMGDLFSLSWAINHLGIFAMRQENWEQAHTYFIESFDLSQTIQSPLRILANHINIAQLALNSRQGLTDAGYHLNEAIILARNFNLAHELSVCLQLMGELALAQGDNSVSEG